MAHATHADRRDRAEESRHDGQTRHADAQRPAEQDKKSEETTAPAVSFEKLSGFMAS
ncbi:hypothetical protein [Teichococcus deserti]|uniref:hypothetical protein n=1 Tax=Teichococcus deserti TaxID=1817963 RepID=UPI0013F5E0EE|nr:hypothetical protein [Pseudoroseomonas deserti]